MRVYNTGFRCASDRPPPSPPAHAGAARPPRADHARVLALAPHAYLRTPIRLVPTECATVRVYVPWFPESLWVVDIPEAHWGPFPGANDWPYQAPDVWRADWHVSPDGTRAWYERRQGEQWLRVEVSAAGNLVTFRAEHRNLGPLKPSAICVKTLSPFFSSQERLTQHRVEADRLLPAGEVPLAPDNAASFGWHVGGGLPHGAVATRSLAGDAFVAIIGAPGAESWGNGWPHCTHLLGAETTGPIELKLLFLLGDEAALRAALVRLG